MTVRIDTCSHYPFLSIFGWWKNFLNQRKNGWGSFAELDRELAKYNARLSGHTEDAIPHQVEFKSEEDMLMFLLRWT